MKLIIQDSKVVGTATDAFSGPEGFIAVADDFDISSLDGLMVVEGELVPKPPSVPTQITPRQGLMMLSRAGLLTAVRQALDLMEGQVGEEARIDFDYASEWRRDWPLLVSMADMLELTSDQVDQMFVEAATL